MHLGFHGSTDVDFCQTDPGVGLGQIAIQCQRPFACRNTLSGAICGDLDEAEKQVRHGILRRQRQGLAQRLLCRCEASDRVVGQESRWKSHIDLCSADQCVHAGRVERQGTFEKALCLRQVLGGLPPVRDGPALEIQVHRVRVCGVLGPPRLSCNQLGVQRVGQPRHNFVLHVEKVGDRFVESLCPKMVARFGADQLYTDAKPATGPLNRAFQDIANVQFAADLSEIDRLALVGKRCVSANDERTADARQVRGQALRHAVGEIVLFGVAAYVCERHHNNGKTRCRGGGGVLVVMRRATERP